MRILETSVVIFLPSQAKKAKLPIFHLWQERMGGCFFKVSSHSGLTLTSGFGFRKFQMDDAGSDFLRVRKWLFFKDVFWLLALLPIEGKSEDLRWRCFTLRGTVLPLPGWGILWYSLIEMFTRVGTSHGFWCVGINLSAQLYWGAHLLYCTFSIKAWSSVPIPAS